MSDKESIWSNDGRPAEVLAGHGRKTKTTQGQSAATLDKERKIGAALAVNMRILNPKFPGYRYWHFDANAGSGWNDDANVPGSPLMFYEMARIYLTQMRLAAFFCDIDPERVAALQKRISHEPDHRIIFGDNDDALQVFAECIRNGERNPVHAVGSVIVDPNGWWFKNQKGIGAPVASLPAFCKEFPKIDLIMNLNYHRYSQMAYHWPLQPPEEVLASLKCEWLVCRTAVAQSRFMLAVGRNIHVNDHARVGLFNWKGPVGQEVLRCVSGNRQSSFGL